jgi:hypothetical protein
LQVMINFGYLQAKVIIISANTLRNWFVWPAVKNFI